MRLRNRAALFVCTLTAMLVWQVAAIAQTQNTQRQYNQPQYNQTQNNQTQNNQQQQQQTQQQSAGSNQQRPLVQRYVENRQVTQDAAQAAAALQNTVQPIMPEGFPLDAESQKWVDQLVQFWEQESEKVRAYKCNFKRWHYMPQFLNYRDPTTQKLAARMVTVGEIRFAKPDRGRYEVKDVFHFSAPQVEGQQPDYLKSEDEETRKKEQEKWITDGKAIYEFDFINQRMNVLELPPEMQGAGIQNSPLPFVFGAKADDLNRRFWIRPMAPEGIPEGHYMIEAYPKTAADARSYSKVQIVLSQKPFLPVRVELFGVNFLSLIHI